jgi:hypothetical protein
VDECKPLPGATHPPRLASRGPGSRAAPARDDTVRSGYHWWRRGVGDDADGYTEEGVSGGGGGGMRLRARAMRWDKSFNLTTQLPVELTRKRV